ncbi:MAG: glycosyltransferase family 1 protein [Halomonas sp.]|nr:glycosyltransferase family 4 protein [Halomonas sp.]TVP45510.1 MAG: glycosyltransferase family 1 protein [Halomonas sp.]
MSINVLYSAGMYSVGGAEILFASVFESKELRQLRQAAVVTRRPHDEFIGLCTSSDNLIFGYNDSEESTQQFGNVRIAKAWIQALIRHKPDIVMFWNEIPPAKIRWLIRVFSPKSKLVLYEHGKSWRRSKSEAITRGLNALDAIIANSKASEALLETKHAVRRTTHVVHNPIPSGRAPNSSISRSLTEGQPIQLGLAGRLVPRKGVAAAVSALQELHSRGVDCRLLIAGDGPYKETLHEFANALGVAESCKWLGHVSDMASFYDSVDVLLIPSLLEPFGLVSVEAQSRGVPVVVSRVDGLPETVIDGATGITVEPTIDVSDGEYDKWGAEAIPSSVFDPAIGSLRPARTVDPVKLADAVERIAGDSATYTRFSESASNHALEKFTWGPYSDSFQSICASIVTTRQSKA